MTSKIYMRSFIFIFLFFSNLAFAAATDLYSFDSPKQQIQFQQLSQQFRCLVCQNESLADSNAPLAKDLRYQVYKMVREGKGDQEIVNYLENRYGEFVSFKPPVTARTSILWFGPFIMLLAALGRLHWLIKQRKKREKKVTLTDLDRVRLGKILHENYFSRKAA